VTSSPLTIFVAHPSVLLTDHRPHGDGLAAYGFISRLAERGHMLHVAVEHVDLARNPGPRVVLHPLPPPPVPGARRPAYALRLGRLYARLAATVRFDVAHQLNPVDVGLTLLLPRTAAPLVLGPYVPSWPAEALGRPGDLSHRLLRRAGDGARRAMLTLQQRRASMLLLSTPAAGERVHAGAGVLLRELSAGVDTSVFVPAPEPPDEPPRILFLANLDRWKGIHPLLEAFDMVAARHPDCRLVVGGDGGQDAAVRARAAASPFAGRIDVLGRVAREEVPALLRACSVYCLPSKREPFGISVLEAMACARPVVVTDAGGLRHLVDDEGGRRVPPDDPPALAAALGEILAAPDARRAMGAHNRRKVEERYEWERVVDRLEELYRELVASPYAPRRSRASLAKRST
jgi:L-malate glycosyltransferase